MPHEISNSVVLVMNSTAVTTKRTWVQFKKVGGSEVLPQIRCGPKKKLPHGDRRSTWDWNPTDVELQ
jgi:hypothetical protein